MSTRTMMGSHCSRRHRKVPKRKAMPARRDPTRSQMTLQPSNNNTIQDSKHPCQRLQRRQQTLWPPVHRSATSPEAQVVCRCWQTTTMFGQTLLTDSCLGVVLVRAKTKKHQRRRRLRQQSTVPSVRVPLMHRPQMVQVNRTRCTDGDCNSSITCSTVRRTTVHLAR